VADPPVSVAVARMVPPSLKVTVPVGVPPPGATTLIIAVNVTGCPNVEGFAEETAAVVVFAWLTAWLSTAEVLVMKLESPL
jgi:hypothetical protein